MAKVVIFETIYCMAVFTLIIYRAQAQTVPRFWKAFSAVNRLKGQVRQSNMICSYGKSQ